MYRHIFFAILITLTVTSCISQKKELKNKNSSNILSDNFIVTKIDSTHSYYLIYVSKGKNLYKIISRKEIKQYKFNTLEIGKSYFLNLEYFVKYNYSNPLTGFNSSLPCFFLDDKTKICMEKGVFGPFKTKNLKGLYYVKN